MSSLSKLSDSIEKNTNKALKTLKYNPASIPFEMKFPIIEKFYDNPSLQQRIANTCRSIGDEQNRKTNVKANMTNWFMWETNSDFETLSKKATEIAIDNSPSTATLMTYDCWGAVYKKGDWTKSHDHWPLIWSWVYNVECCNNCAPLVLTRDTTLRIPVLEVSKHVYSLTPRVGKFTMFPGWIQHSVPKHECDHDRIIVAGNIGLNPYAVIEQKELRSNE